MGKTCSIRHRNKILYKILERQRILPPTSAPRPALGPTQPPVQWVRGGALSPGVKRGRGVMLTTHPLLVPRLRKSRSCTSSHPKAPLWSVTGPLYLFTITVFLDFARRVTLLREHSFGNWLHSRSQVQRWGVSTQFGPLSRTNNSRWATIVSQAIALQWPSPDGMFQGHGRT
jgi:hypothetical protein